MRLLARLRPHLPALLGATLGAAVSAWLGLFGIGWNDYAWEALPAFSALVHGHVGAFLTLSPAYGGSMVLRAPFALVPNLWGGGDLAVYRAVAFPALVGSVLMATWLASRMREQGQSLLARATTIGLVTAGPVAVHALEIGHSEELLAGILCVAALACALRERGLWAGLLLGLAVATKMWAIVAVAPVLLAVGPRWWRTALVAGLATVAVLAPLVFNNAQNFGAKGTGVAATHEIFQPDQVFWFAGSEGHVVTGGDGQAKDGYRAAPAWVSRIDHPLVALVGLLLPLLWLVRRRGRRPADLLLVLALVLHLRCLLDVWNIGYYAAPMILALVLWEALARRRAPVLGLAVSVLVWATFSKLPSAGATPDQQTLFYLAWALPVAAGLGLRALAPGLLGRMGVHAPSSQPVAVPTT